MPVTKWIEGTVVGQTHWTDKILSLQVKADIGSFEPGQHATLALPVNGELVTRPYSFVNGPKERPCEFHYVIVPDGPFTARLAKLEAMDVVFLAPSPSGLFVLSAIPDADTLWLLATGTGIGPLLPAEDSPSRGKVAAIAREHPAQLRVILLASREEAAGALAGRIAETIED